MTYLIVFLSDGSTLGSFTLVVDQLLLMGCIDFFDEVDVICCDFDVSCGTLGAVHLMSHGDARPGG